RTIPPYQLDPVGSLGPKDVNHTRIGLAAVLGCNQCCERVSSLAEIHRAGCHHHFAWKTTTASGRTQRLDTRQQRRSPPNCENIGDPPGTGYACCLNRAHAQYSRQALIAAGESWGSGQQSITPLFNLRTLQHMIASTYARLAPFRGKQRLLPLLTAISPGGTTRSYYGARMVNNASDSTWRASIAGSYGTFISDHINKINVPFWFLD